MSEATLLSGELHYWRISRSAWEPALASARALGVECIATYVPWFHHERAPGRYDFAELVEFLELLRAREFRALVRPGPFIYAECRNLGVPDRAVPFAKHTREFRELAGEWLDAVLSALAPYLGSPIVLLQADNEIDPMPHVHGEDQGFAGWLERRYGSLAALNTAWGSELSAFADALPMLVPFTDGQHYRDSQLYRYELATDYARWVVARFRSRVGTFPLALNSWPFVNAQHWRDLADLVEVYGIDPYPENECASSYRELREQLRLLRAVTRRPFVAELGLGIWHGVPCDFTPEHYRLTALSALAAGVHGWNWYMLVGRDHWSGAAIDAHGELDQRLALALREACASFELLRDAPRPSVSCGVTWSWAEHQTAATLRRRIDDPLLAALFEMGIEYDFVDVDRAPLTPAPELLFVASSLTDARVLERHAAQGGTVVFFQRLAPGCAAPDGSSHHAPQALEVSLGFSTDAPVFAYRDVPGAPITAVQKPWSEDPDLARLQACAVGRRYVVGYVEPRGRGRWVVLGCAPSVQAVLAVHRAFGFELPARSTTPGVHVSRRGATLIAVNPGAACTAHIEVGARAFELELARCGARVVRLDD
ncbi:MAG: beta-galactosidase [Planctomycetes bacterium]|nr:beta-galactosidase [Planctomycetota bacterium]